MSHCCPREVYLSWTPAPGAHTLVVTPYSGPGAAGPPGAAVTVQFTVTGSTPTPTPPTPTPPTPTPGTGGPLDTFTSVDWAFGANAEISRSEALKAEVGGKIYVFGGFARDANGVGPVVRSDVYDPATDSWRRIKDLPRSLTHTGVASEGRDVYFVAGYYGREPGTFNQEFNNREVWRYNVDADAYSRMPDLPVGLSSGVAAVVGRELHYIGGNDAARNDVNVHHVLDLDNPAAGWKTAAPIPEARSHQGVAVLGDKIYAVAGQTVIDDAAVAHNTVQVYDTATDTWSRAAPTPKAVSHVGTGVFTIGGRVVIAGGETGPGKPGIRDVYAYTPSTNQWTPLTPMPVGRVSGVAAFVDGKIYYLTGRANTVLIGTPRL